MKKEQQTLTSPFLGLLQLEAIHLMKQGWAIKKPAKSVWSWRKFHYVFKIVMVNVGEPVETDQLYADIVNHLDDLAAYNKTVPHFTF